MEYLNHTASLRDKYDVLIVGGNIAGLCCASVLANSNLSVLIVERRADVGTKLCTGIVMPLVSNRYYANENALVLPRYMVKLSESSQCRVIDGPMTIVARSHITNRLHARLAAARNLSYLAPFSVRDIQPGFVTINGHAVGYETLVGSDGSNSAVRRYLGLGRDTLNTLVYIAEPRDIEPTFEIFDRPGNGYAWATPVPGGSQGGTLWDPRHATVTEAKQRLHGFLDRFGFDYGNAKLKSHPISYGYEGIEFGNVFLAGDAAGLANRKDGEGIYEAIVSGEEVAAKIMNRAYDMSRVEALLARRRVPAAPGTFSTFDVTPKVPQQSERG